MKFNLVRSVACGLLLSLSLPLLGQAPEPAPAPQGQKTVDEEAQDRGWPRKFEAEGHEVIVFAPQVEEWPKFERVKFRAAISVGLTGSDDRAYGVLRASAHTDIALEDRLVVLTDRQIDSLVFPDVDPGEVERLKAIVLAAAPPARPQTISLDRLVAALALVPTAVDVRKVDVNTAPPKIFFSMKPAILVMFMGKPRFQPVPDNDLMFAVNTNWDIFMDAKAGMYYMLVDKSWLAAPDIEKGPWTAAASLPASLSKLPPNDNWKDVLAAIPGQPAKDVPVVLTSQEPAELIVTDGSPQMELIPGTKLMRVKNTENDLFYSPIEQKYFLLAAGRWFKSGPLAGPWAAASDSLPEDFKNLPSTPETDDILASVPGTPAANEAMIMASIPNKATINRADVSVNVTYDGAPNFQPIQSTTVQYAANSPNAVFMVDGAYYCCSNAVWFQAPTPTGAWTVCTAVPPAIYAIPPTSPNYNVTYVQVYQSTPTTVVTGYTAGYSGATVAATGVVMFGLGMAVGAAIANNNDCCWAYHYPPSYYSYGCGAVWNGGYGGFVAAGAYYGPYGGAGHAAAYNPATGVYSRAGYAYGPNGAAGYRTAYNPATGTAAGHAGGVTPYGSWGASAVTNGDKWATASHQTTAAGTTGQIHTSSGASAATVQGRYGNGATVAKSSSGDYYASVNGNVYKSTGNGYQQASSTYKGTGSTSSSTSRPPTAAPAPTTERPPTTTPPANEAPKTTSSSGSGTSTSRPASTQSSSRSPNEELSQQSAARSRGEQNASRANQTRSGGGYGGGQRSGGPRGGGRR